jgi:hypothetical protein
MESSQTLWHLSVMPALGRLKQEDHDFEVSQCYTTSFRLA